MNRRRPFVLLDDAREPMAGAEASAAKGAIPADALLYEDPRAIFTTMKPGDVQVTLDAARAAQLESGGALVGYLAYEAGLALEPKLADMAAKRSGAAGPLVWLGLFDEAETIPANAVAGKLAQLRCVEGADVAADAVPARLGPLDPQISPGGYAQGFAAMHEAIHAGDIYQANYTYPLAGAYRGDPIALYEQLRAAARAGHGGILFDGTHWLLSLSPELFVASDGKVARTRPMKGTRPRSDDPATDAQLAADLAGSAKDRAENLMILDLMRNDLARIAEAGSVKVSAPFAIESYPSVHQMVSSISARLLADSGPMELLRALFPCGSITGAPKIRAMELINAQERDARGPYCGALGRIDPPDDAGRSAAAFNVAIRTLRLTPTENGHGQAVYGTGSAITADSDALAERRECEVKTQLLRMPQPAVPAKLACDLIETMRFEPETGIALLERHLARLKKSAQILGFEFDRHQARNQIQALCFELEAAAKVRLLVAASGALVIEAAPLPQTDASAIIKAAALPLPVSTSDWRLCHKTSDRGFYEDALEAAQAHGAGEAILVREDGEVTEGARTNVFVERGGKLITPPADRGLLPGILREELIEEGRCVEGPITLDDLNSGFWLGNAVRGLLEARLI